MAARLPPGAATTLAPIDGPLDILVLTRHDGGGATVDGGDDAVTGHVERWRAAGHAVTVIGGRRRRRAVLRAAPDVVVEVVRGRVHGTPLWRGLHAPVVVLALDAPRDRVALRLLYGEHDVVATTAATHTALLAAGVPPSRLHADTPAVVDGLLAQAVAAGRPRLVRRVRRSDTGRAAGLAGATLINSAIQLAFTIAATRILGTDGYGALAALVSAFLLMYVGGQSVQAAAARQVALHALGDAARLRATVDAWTQTLAAAAGGALALGIVIRGPLADAVGVPEHPWAAAALPLTGVLWMLLSLQRGVLQGLHAFGPVAKSLVVEPLGRLVLGVVLAVTADVTGASLALPACFLATSVWLALVLRRRLGHPEADPPRHTLRALVAGGWVAIGGLVLLAVLQNIDIIVARHQLGEDRAGSYAVAAVAAKSVVFVAVGIGLQVLPQATRNAAAGLDPRPVLARALALLGVVAVPAVVVLLAIPGPILSAVFGPDTREAAGALRLLAVAMALLAVAYLAVQYMIALGRTRFLWVLLAVAVAEVAALATLADPSITGYALVVAAAQLAASLGVLVVAGRGGAVRTARAARPGA